MNDLVKAGVRNKIKAFEAALKTVPGAVIGKIEGNPDEGFPVEHHFANGVYCRQLKLPKNSLSVGKIHRYPCNNILLKGKLAIMNAEGAEPEIHEAPEVWQSPGGSKRAVHALEDTIWVTTHPVDKSYTVDDLDKIEAEVIVKTFKALDEERSCHS